MSIRDTWRSPLDPERVMQSTIAHWQDEQVSSCVDRLAVEEPFEVRIDHRSLAVIMRTPGHDQELAFGFLLTEGIIRCANDVMKLEHEVDADNLPLANVLTLTLRVPLADQGPLDCQVERSATFERHFAVSSSCGLCGKNSIADLLVTVPPLEPDQLRIGIKTIYQLSDRLRSEQVVFTHTGGLHAAALFQPEGELLAVREDIGRHNAVDKLIGYGLQHGFFPYDHHILLVSGRASFEIIQKALLARIPCVAAISAPSSLAVELAQTAGITLIGFLRDRSLNVYTHPERIINA